MAESMKPLLPGLTNGNVQSPLARTDDIPKPKYILPIPLRTFPLPTFYPSNPVSLLHLVIAWARQIIYPPAAEPSVIHHGVWSPETRSVHVTDPKSMNDLWCQGFFGKGSLSRSEPNWSRRQLGETSEQRTAKRREERASTKWERGRSELEALEQKRREEEACAAAKHAVESLKEKIAVSGKEKQVSSILNKVDDMAPTEPKSSTFKAPVGPLELLALPNSHADLARASLAGAREGSSQDGFKAQPLFRPPVGPLELLALPNSAADLLKAFPTREKASDPQPACEDTSKSPLIANQLLLQNGKPSLKDTVANGVGAYSNGVCVKVACPRTKEECNDNGVGGNLGDIPALKHQKSVRFAANVESTTFQRSDPPNPNHLGSTAVAKQLGGGRAMNGKAVAPAAENRTTKAAVSSPAVKASHDAESDKEQSEAVMNVAELTQPNKEHLQLSAEEAFFLAYGLGALVVADPESKAPLTTAQLFMLFRRFSYFPPRTPDALSTDDPFLIHYAVYHHFRSLGWVPRHGIKFGVDWLLYGKGPALDHAEFGIIVMPSYTNAWWKTNGREAPRKSWHWLHSVNRVLSTVFKTLVLVYVDVPPPSVSGGSASEILQQFRIQEVVVRRWSHNRNRD